MSKPQLHFTVFHSRLHQERSDLSVFSVLALASTISCMCTAQKLLYCHLFIIVCVYIALYRPLGKTLSAWKRNLSKCTNSVNINRIHATRRRYPHIILCFKSVSQKSLTLYFADTDGWGVLGIRYQLCENYWFVKETMKSLKWKFKSRSAFFWK